MRLSRRMILASLVPFLIVACAPDTRESHQQVAADRPRPHVMTVTVYDYSFQAPDSIPAGLVMIQALMRGDAPHHVAVVKLDGNRTAAEYIAALRPDAPPPEWATHMGGPNPTDPGTTANAMMVLEPGSYALVCYVDVPGGVPHFAHGMFKDLRVYERADTAAAEPAAPATAELPAGTVTMRLTDYDFSLDGNLTAGQNVIRVVNDAAQWHEVVLVQLQGNTTVEQALGWIQRAEGPPPFSMLGGIAPISQGVQNNFTVNLRPGRYALVCLLPDAGDGRPHIEHGMIEEFTIR
jgi:hypothetical protein